MVSVETEFGAPISAGGLGKIVPPMAHQKQLFLRWLWASDPLSVNAFYESRGLQSVVRLPFSLCGALVALFIGNLSLNA